MVGQRALRKHVKLARLARCIGTNITLARHPACQLVAADAIRRSGMVVRGGEANRIRRAPDGRPRARRFASLDLNTTSCQVRLRGRQKSSEGVGVPSRHSRAHSAGFPGLVCWPYLCLHRADHRAYCCCCMQAALHHELSRRNVGDCCVPQPPTSPQLHAPRNPRRDRYRFHYSRRQTARPTARADCCAFIGANPKHSESTNGDG